ncbi:hypothetical protein L596_012011 [Steinernema carpocapsae]|uniref:Uncharacterized protein n=1 Tax=Steinernema carpocapsae TaxID=34508 RepID=A0A4U5NWM0_STECR|nr:hypothetical protein L596_012011 [Steinernema carpocapsae]
MRSFHVLFRLLSLCVPFVHGSNKTYVRVPSWFLDDEVVYRFLQILPSETDQFMSELTDKEFNDYTKILRNASQVVNQTYCPDSDKFEDEAGGLPKHISDHLNLCAKEISEKVYDKMQTMIKNILSKVNEVRNGDARSYLMEVIKTLTKLNPRTWHRVYTLKTLLEMAGEGRSLSTAGKIELGEKFLHVLQFIEDKRTNILLDKKKCCQDADILREMVDEAKYQMKNGKPMSLEVVEERWQKKTTVRCDQEEDCGHYKPQHCGVP